MPEWERNMSSVDHQRASACHNNWGTVNQTSPRHQHCWMLRQRRRKNSGAFSANKYWPGVGHFSLVSCSVMSDSLQPRGLKHARPPCPSTMPGTSSNSCSSSRWYHPTISSSVVPFSCLQSFPASGSFQMSQFFTSGGQSIGYWAPTVLESSSFSTLSFCLFILFTGFSRQNTEVVCHSLLQWTTFCQISLKLSLCTCLTDWWWRNTVGSQG